MIGHNAAVTCGDWSHDATMVLTASADRSVRLWNAACAQPLLEFTHVNSQVGGRAPARISDRASSKNTVTNKKKSTIKSQVSACSGMPGPGETIRRAAAA